MAKALYPGSFDPFHLGHLDVLEQAAAIFDEVIVAVLGNPRKPSGLFAIAERLRLASGATAHLPNVRCLHSEMLTIDVARSQGAAVIIRSGHKEGRHEMTMAAMNEQMSGVQTLFAVADPTRRLISSSWIRNLISRGETYAAARLVPEHVGQALLALGRARSPS